MRQARTPGRSQRRGLRRRGARRRSLRAREPERTARGNDHHGAQRFRARAEPRASGRRSGPARTAAARRHRGRAVARGHDAAARGLAQGERRRCRRPGLRRVHFRRHRLHRERRRGRACGADARGDRCRERDHGRARGGSRVPLLHRVHRDRRSRGPASPARGTLRDRRKPRRGWTAAQGARAHTRQRSGRGVSDREPLRGGLRREGRRHAAPAARGPPRRTQGGRGDRLGRGHPGRRDGPPRHPHGATQGALRRPGLPRPRRHHPGRVLRRARSKPAPPEDVAAAAGRLPSPVRVPRLALPGRNLGEPDAQGEWHLRFRRKRGRTNRRARQGHRARLRERIARTRPCRDVCRRMRAGRLRRGARARSDAGACCPARARSD